MSEPGVRRVLRQPLFRLELLAYTLVSASMGVATVVVSVAMFRRGGTTAWATVGVVSRIAPYVLFSTFSGAIAGRFDQRRVLQVAFAVQVVAAGLLFASVSSAPLLLVAAIGFAGQAAWTVAYPSMAALLARTVEHDDLAVANGLLSSVESLAWIAGPGLGGLVITAAGMRQTIVVQAVLAVLGLLLATMALRVGPAGARPSRHERERLVDSVRNGIRAVGSTPAVLHPLVLLLVSNVVYGALQVLMLVVAWKRLGMSEGGYGALCAGLGAGAFAALVMVGPAAARNRPDLVLAGAVLLGGIPLALLAVASVPAVGIVLLALSGLGMVLTEVLALTAAQQHLPPDRIAGVFGLLDSSTVTAMLIGTLAAGPLISWLGLEAALVVVGAVMPVAAVLAVPTVARRRTARRAALDEVVVIAGGSSPGAAVRNAIINR
jgi:predicted MFS family arabinose efflux permease